MISFDDGTFATIEAVTAKSSPLSNNKVSAVSVITRFIVKSRSDLNIYDLDDAGTSSWFSTSIERTALNRVKKEGKTVQSKGTFKKVNGVSIGGQTLGNVDIFSLITTINIKSSSSSKVSVKANFSFID